MLLESITGTLDSREPKEQLLTPKGPQLSRCFSGQPRPGGGRGRSVSPKASWTRVVRLPSCKVTPFTAPRGDREPVLSLQGPQKAVSLSLLPATAESSPLSRGTFPRGDRPSRPLPGPWGTFQHPHYPDSAEPMLPWMPVKKPGLTWFVLSLLKTKGHSCSER